MHPPISRNGYRISPERVAINYEQETLKKTNLSETTKKTKQIIYEL